MVIPAGFEPAIFWMRTRRPKPLDDGTDLASYYSPYYYSILWLIINAPVFGDGGDDSLSGSKLNLIPSFVSKFDLSFAGGFGPLAGDGDAVLENIGIARADGSDVLVIIVGGTMFGDDHGYDRGGRHGGEITGIFGVGSA